MILTNDHMSVNIYTEEVVSVALLMDNYLMCECFVSLYIRNIINAHQRIHTVNTTLKYTHMQRHLTLKTTSLCFINSDTY